MARKKTVHHAKRKIRVRRKNAAEAVSRPIANPPMGTDIVQFILPGFAAYAGTRFLNRVVFTQVHKRWPKWAKHSAAVSSVASFLAVWLLGHKIKRIEKYHTPIVVGAAIASMQTLVQTYLPKYGWIVSDVSADQYKDASKQLPSGVVPLLPAPAELEDYSPLEPLEDEDDGEEAQGDDDALVEGLGSLEAPEEFSVESEAN